MLSRAEKISLYVVARMMQASLGRIDKQQQEQTSPNHVQGLFLSSVQGSHKENLVNFVPAIFLPPFPGLVSRILATWGLSFLATPVRYLSPSVLLFPR